MTTAEIGKTSLDLELAAAYRRDGAVLVRNVLSGEELEWLEAGLDEVHAAPSDMFSKYGGTGGDGLTVIDQLPSLRSPHLRRLVEEGPIAELAGELMGTPSAQLVLDQMFYKEAGRIVPTPWHQDTPFLRVRGHDMARVWLTCDPSPRDVTLQVIRGSHLWNVVYDTAVTSEVDIAIGDEGEGFSYSGIGDDRLPQLPDIEGHRDSFDILGWDVEPGDAVVFHGNIIHGASGKAGHPHPRRAFASMWGGPDLRFHNDTAHAMPLPSEAASDGDAVPHGTPIGDRPDVFPVFWNRDRGSS